MIQGFEFVHEGRTFTCTVEAPRPSSPDVWWWFRVSSDKSQRYAPFQVGQRDTRASVSARIVQFYDNLLKRRAEPPTSYWRRGAPQKPNGQAAGATGAAAESTPQAPAATSR